jgi:hypothetical protein
LELPPAGYAVLSSSEKEFDMRRSLFAGIGALAVFIFAACSPDQPNGSVLAPTEPSLAPSGGSQQCAGSLASSIASQQKALFTKAQQSILDPILSTIKSTCSTSVVPNPAHGPMMQYLQKVVDFRGTVEQTRGTALINLMASLILYVDNATFTRSWTILRPSTLVAGTEDGDRSGGAEVLDPAGDLSMTTFDGQAGVKINSPQSPTGPHLFTLDPAGCPATSLVKATEDCYNIQVYPEVSQWSPKINIGMCIHGGASSTTAIIHGASQTYTEVLPSGAPFPWSASDPSCVLTHTFINSWLGREAGPLGRALAKALDYLRPQPLLADDAGESGLGLFTSPFGGASTVIFSHNFDNLNFILTPPDVGDSLRVQATSPGYIQLQNNIPGMTGSAVVLSQAQGNCVNCPVFALIGTRVNSSISESTGSYEVTWTSLQTKPNIKEAPFVVLNGNGLEIARLSYLTESSQNILRLTVPTATGTFTQNVGFWTQNVAQSFKITVNLTTLGLNPSNTVSFSGDGLTSVSNQPAVNATSLFQIGYLLTGIDAGIMASDNWRVTRIADSAGNP